MNTKYLYSKLGYTVRRVKNYDDILQLSLDFKDRQPKYCGYDTETTGLNHMKDTPFLVVFGFDKDIYYCTNEDKDIFDAFIYTMFDLVRNANILLFAHNAKFDYHMLFNNGTPIPKDIKLADTMTLARLVESADDTFASVKLEKIGEKYVDPDAKFAGVIIKDILQKLRKERKKIVCTNYKLLTGETKYTDAWQAFIKKVNFITEHHEVFNDYKEPNYYDAYLEEPELMCDYACDDVVIMLEFIQKIMPIYCSKYFKDGVVNNEVFFRENELISHIAEVERQGFKVNLQYIIDSHYKMRDFKEKLYDRLHELTKHDWKVGQNQKIKDYFFDYYGIEMDSADKKAIAGLLNVDNSIVQEVSKLISKLRTVDKWLSTYVDGVLNRIMEVDGIYKLYTTIHNNGTVSGRVSSNLQQMPKFPLMDFEDNEVFHPRRYVIPSDNYKLFFLDYSQIELRIQAYYTILANNPDYNLCRAYMAYGCISRKTWEQFDYKKETHIQNWDSGEWVNKDGSEWQPTDLHSATTKKAFPEIKEDTPEFKEARYLGKMTNFSSNYGVGTKKLAEQLSVPMTIAEKLRKSYSDTFPGVAVYNREVSKMLALKGFVENLYGRKYYIESSNNYYKGSNYLVQGSAADSLKSVEIKICEYLADKKSRFLMAIHDRPNCRV
jgi:DNA polymerase I-like protein with 3'-5' exonuclease and polymerase domains